MRIGRAQRRRRRLAAGYSIRAKAGINQQQSTIICPCPHLLLRLLPLPLVLVVRIVLLGGRLRARDRQCAREDGPPQVSVRLNVPRLAHEPRQAHQGGLGLGAARARGHADVPEPHLRGKCNEGGTW
jgi:hypothetical protein